MNGLDSLDLFDFGILLQALANNMKVGVLVVHGEDRVKYLQIERSKLLAIYTGRPKVSLGKVLYNHRAIEKATLREAMAAVQAEAEGRPLGSYLLSRKHVTREQLRRANQYQMLEETLELFYWKNVGFKFIHNGTRDTLPEKDLVAVGEPIEVDSILIQCTKTIDDISKFDEVTPSLRDVYELHIDSFDTLKTLVPDPAQREFVLLIDGVRDMREVLRDMRMNRFEVLEFFYRFRREALIRPKNAFELLMLAENRRKEFSLEKRARVYERINELGVEGFDVVLPLAETYEELGMHEKAAALFARHARKCAEAGDSKGSLTAVSRASRLMPGDPELREFEIDALIKAGKEAEAGAAYKALAEIREKAGDTAAALAALAHAAHLHPADAANWTGLAELLAKTGRPRRAAARLRCAGDVLRKAGDATGAAEAYRRALALCDGAWSVRYRLVEILHESGRDDVAVQELADLIQFVLDGAPSFSPEGRMNHLVHIEECLQRTGGMTSSAATHLGRAYAKSGAEERAVGVYRAAAEALTGATRHRGAVETLEELIEIAPNDLDARRALARSHLALGDTNRALAQLRRIGAMNCAQKAWSEAREAYEEMLRADPGCADAHAGLAHTMLELGDARLASTHFHRAALLHRGSGKVDAAASFFQEAVAKNPGDPELLEEYCELLLSTDRRDQQLQALSALVELRMGRNQPARAAIALTRILEIDSRYPGAKKILHDAAQQLSCMADASTEISAAEAKAIVDAAKAAAQTA